MVSEITDNLNLLLILDGNVPLGFIPYFIAICKHEGTSTNSLGKELICRQLRSNDMLATFQITSVA